MSCKANILPHTLNTEPVADVIVLDKPQQQVAPPTPQTDEQDDTVNETIRQWLKEFYHSSEIIILRPWKSEKEIDQQKAEKKKIIKTLVCKFLEGFCIQKSE